MTSMMEVKNGIKSRIETIPDFTGRVYSFIPGTQDPPSVTIVPGTFIPGDTKAAITYGRTMGGSAGATSYIFTLAVVVSTSQPDDRLADQLDGYLSPHGDTSIKQAVEGDITLGGISGYCFFREVIQYGALTWNSLNFFGAQIVVEVTL